MPLAASLLVLCAMTASADMLQFRRDKTHSPDGLASYDLPNGWSPRDPIREPTYALIPYRKTQSWWFGAGDPLEVYAWVVIMTPNADETLMRKALEEGHRRVMGDTKEFPAFGSIKEGDRETWVSDGSYQIHSNHDPEKIIIVRSLDRARRVAFVAREWEEPRDMTKCGLDAWFDDALEFEKAFKANEIRIG